MDIFSESALRTDDLIAESSGDGMLDYCYVDALASANQELRQQLELVTQAYNLLAARCGPAVDRGLSSQVWIRAAAADERVFGFGPFQMCPSKRLLLEGNRKVQIGSRAFDILTILVERAGEVVSKDEVMARVWPNVYVEDGNLKTQVCGLRRALDKTDAGRRYIVTVPGRGYNFVAPVSLLAGALLDTADPRQRRRGDHTQSERCAA